MLDLNDAGELGLYVDGADEATRALHLIKGGGGALTREKIVAAASRRFVCIVDEKKLVERLGALPAAGRGDPDGAQPTSPRATRAGSAASPCGARAWSPTTATTSSTCAASSIPDPVALEGEINQLAGVVTVGLFARRPADVLLVGTASGVVTLARDA